MSARERVRERESARERAREREREREHERECTQKAYFCQILFTNLSKSVLVSTSPLPR